MENEKNRGFLSGLIDKVDPQVQKEIAGIGTEVGTGLALDAKTQGLLGLGPWGWLGYGAINFAGGASANIAAQKIRGIENTRWGEVISSGLLGIIPGTSLRFAKPITKVVGEANTVKRAATFGATQGLTDQVIQKGLDEKRLPTPAEAAIGIGTGGVIGGTLKHVQLNPDESGKLRIMWGKVNDPKYVQGEFFTDVDAVSRNLPDFITYPMARDMPAYSKEVPAGYVDYYKMQNWFYASETSGRKALETYMTPVVPGTQISRGVSFGGLAKAELPKLKRDFAPILKALKIDNVDSANIHHIAALKATFGILHKVQYDSPLYREVYDTLLQHIPGLGNMGENLVPVIGRTKGKAQVSTPHYLVHRFYADKIGESGELFFTEEVLNKMVKSKAYRLEKANELGKIIARSEKIVKDAQRIWRLGFSQENIHFEVIVNELSKLDELGYSKLSSTKYQTPALSEMIKDIVTDIKGAKGPILQPPPKRKVDPSKITQRERMIRESDIIKETKAVDKGVKPSNPDQTKLDL